MAIKITIVGLGQIGASVGLALGEQGEMFERIGHDRSLEVARRAQKMGAVDRVALNLPSSVREADMVLLSLPIDQIKETLAAINQDLKDNTVVMDTGPVKEVTTAWASELLPDKNYYVGLIPVLNPAYLHGLDSGLDAARSDLFKRGMMAIVSAPGTPSDAIKLAADLTRLLGATPFFADPLEIDSLMAATHTLPHLIAAALVNSTVDQPGWREGRKIAGRLYAEVTSPISIFNEPKTLSQSALLNRANVVRVLDGVIAALQTLRTDIEGQDDRGLENHLERARVGREQWWKLRQAANWSGEEVMDSMAEAPTGSEVFGRLLGLGRKRKQPGK